MENLSSNDANSLRKTLKSTSISSHFSGSAAAGRAANDDQKHSATLLTESNRSTTPKESGRRDTASISTNSYDLSVENSNQESHLQKLKHEMERLRSKNQSAEKKNEMLRWLLTSEHAEPARIFHRAILMRLYPEEIINAIGVRHDSNFVALEATLFTSKFIPIQKVSTSFSDGHWQEEMSFVLDTESRWMEGRFVLELKTKNDALDDVIIATASISPHCFLDWLQEGGEHSVHIKMDRTHATLDDELALPMLFFTVKVAAERIPSNWTPNIEAPQESVIDQPMDEKTSHAAIKSPNHHGLEVSEVANKVPALPGIPDETVVVSMARKDPCLSVSAQPLALEAAFTNTDSITAATSSTDDEDAKTMDSSSIVSTMCVRRFESVPAVNRSCSAEFVESAVSQSLSSMVYQRKNGGEKIILQPVQEGSKQCTQIKMRHPLVSDSKPASNHAELRKPFVSKTPCELGLLEIRSGKSEKHVQQSKHQETNTDPNVVAAITGVSFVNQRLMAIIKQNGDSKCDVNADSIIASKNSDSSALVEPLQPTSRNPDHAAILPVEEINHNSAVGCLHRIGSSLALWFAAAQMMLARAFGQCHRRQRLATVRPVHDVFNVESEVETLTLSDHRRRTISNKKKEAKKFLKECEIDNDTVLPTDIGPEKDVYDPVDEKLSLAVSQLQNAFFHLPKRATKTIPVLQIMQFMKTLPTGNSTPHQRLAAIRHFLQSKWIDCESMLQIMTWIKSPSEEVKIFECMAMRIVDKQGLVMIARRFLYARGTKFVALKTVERLLDLSNKDTRARQQRRASHFRQENVDDFAVDEQDLPANIADFPVDESENL
jgi:hypothetical protein